jgi:ABC-type transport system involved in multi-copper enzyme maturation permease subunit
MVLTIAGFELRQRLRRISTYVYFLVFFGLSLLFANMAGGAIPQASVEFGTGGKVLVNSPYVLNIIITYITFFGIVVTAALAGQATYQDIDTHSTDLFYTAPITKFDYLGGRFLGSLATQLLVFSSVGLGAWVATLLPWIDRTRLGPQIALAYWIPYFISVLPNLIVTSAIFFSLAVLGKKMLPVYAGSVLLLIGYFVAQQLSTNLTVNVPAALADPFGATAVDRLTQYWSPFQRNTQLIPLSGIVLWNRLLWLGFSAALLAFTYARFSLSYPTGGRAGKKQLRLEDALPVAPAQVLPIAHPTFSSAASLRQFLSLTRIQFTETVRNVFFIVLALAGGLFAAFSANGVNNPFSTHTYPLTYQMLESGIGGFFIFALAIITFYAGELVWRERDASLNQIVDALPVERWVLFSSKLATLMLVQVVLVLIVMAAGIAVQLMHGYHHLELGLYFTDLFGVRLIQFWFLCVLAFLIHTLVNQKYLGHFVMVLYFVSTITLPALGLQHFLYRYGQSPPYTYSDMNGYGPFAAPLFWFHLYWAIAAVALALVTNMLWVRGTESNLRVRLQIARTRLSAPVATGLAACATLMLIVGGYIFYNTNVLNPYFTTYAIDEGRAQYEKKYRQYKDLPQPKITEINTQIDLDPANRGVEMRGTMTLENKSDSTIDRVAITVLPVDLAPVPPPHPEIKKLSFAGGQTALLEDKVLGFYLYRLTTPLPPHGRIAFDYDVTYRNIGFVNSNPNLDLVHNGTFLNDRYAPFIGYAPDIELTDDSTRHKHGLDKAKRMPKLEDVAARNENGISSEADWIHLESTVSTSSDQIAIMPGYLQNEWTENGRRYFHYKMDAPILNLYSMQSARYSVRRDKWRDVNLEIYYQPGHEFDLDRMMDSLKASLDYCSAAFSPFQFHQLRIIEFPRYGIFAESFANTIPFSEAIGFITYVDPNKADDVDIPFYVTSHETAHQWWAHQVMSANVEGETSIVETLAQYSALMVMKHRYGPESMKKFLRLELENYLRGRAQERNEETPLYRADVNQGYIHYGKGAVVMYEMQDYIGEDNVNKALAELVKQFAFKGPPYSTSLDLISYLQKYTPPEFQYLYDDLWKNITLYDNHAKSATYVQQPDGKYLVDLVVVAKKVRADGKGEEHPVPLHDFIDIGVEDASGKFLYLQRQKIEQEETEFKLVVDKLPTQAGIDPIDKLIDRNPDDNVITVEKR